MTSDEILITLSAIGLITIFCQWFAWWVKLPAILFLLIVGIIIGPVLGWLNPDELFGPLLFPFISLSVAVILFEGSLTLKLEEIRGLERVVQNMISVGMLVTWAITSICTKYIVGFTWELALLFGAVTVVTGPTVIVPILRTVRPNARVSNILRWEGIVIDPIGALLAVLVYEFIISGGSGDSYLHTLWTFIKILSIGGAIGGLSGFAVGMVLRNHWIPEYLRNVFTLSLVFTVFTASNVIQEESGLLTVTVMGMWLANMKKVPVDDILDFKESLSILLISALFILLAARLNFSQLQTLGLSALFVFLAIQFLARPIKVIVSTFGSTLSWRERMLIGWVAPRGIVAAAIAALFALKLQQFGYAKAELIVPLTFMVIIGTVVLQSVTARPLAQFLGIAEPEPKGFLIIGANAISREIAKELNKQGFRVLLTDSNWESIRKARMDNLHTFYGNPISEHADRHLDLVGIGRCLAMSPQGDLNTLASLRYRGEFGTKSVFSLPSSIKPEGAEKHQVAAHRRGNILFSEKASYSKLASLISKGATIRTTRLTEGFGYDEYIDKYKKDYLLLFVIGPKDNLTVVTPDYDGKPKQGSRLISLIFANE